MTGALRRAWTFLPFAVALVAAEAQPAASAGCEDFVPASCTRVTPSTRIDPVVDKCFVFDEGSTGTYSYDALNVLAGGGLYFVDPGHGKKIDFRVSALLIEKGGVVQAGSPKCPLGKEGGKLEIGLFGSDPTKQGTVTPPVSQRGIQCLTNKDAAKPELRCFPSDDYATGRYCTTPDSDDPCKSTTPPASEPKNALLEPYHSLNFDDNPWGYKTIGVAYGGSLALYGYKGARALQDDGAWAREFDSSDHCVVPSAAQSTLDVAEMQAWAELTGTSWTRLVKTQDSGEFTLVTVDRDVPDWQVDDQIVIGATDWYPHHSEPRKILEVVQGQKNTFKVEKLKYPHNTSLFDAKQVGQFSNDVNRTAADTRAVVGLLSRSIQIYSRGATSGEEFPKIGDCVASSTKKSSECYFGGHLIARQGFKQVAIQGAEFKWLGQGGRMGHYPVHFHLAKSTAYTSGREVSGTFVKDSSVWDSMTRFVVVHGTHDLTVARNVGYLSLGSGYFIEDASEIRNRLCHNLGVDARAALEQYVTEQEKHEHWCGGEPPAAARVVPPILDGSIQSASQSAPTSPTGSDTYMPTMFWMMNAYNEFVGNAAVGVHGFGSCFWLLGSAVSGASRTHQFDGFAGYNTESYQAPLLRFRGNSCVSSPLALPSTREVKPGGGMNEARDTGFTDIKNPYLTNGAPLTNNYARPIINGNFRPLLNGTSMSCSDGSDSQAILANNTKACVATVIDRFQTSFNWAEVNFASIWLRPGFYLFSNAAVTDQLFGGLGIVTGGDWQQAPPAYLALAQNNLFVGSTQPQDPRTNLYARRSGPRFSLTSDAELGAYGPCRGNLTCNVDAAGTGYWFGGFQPKRMITIYDGPTYGDGNAFMNVGAWKCNAQPCAGARSVADCKYKVDGVAELECGIYSSTTQPALTTTEGDDTMVVLDAGIGWKQPNGFYYPPAFAYRRSAFPKNVSDDLNMCFTAAPGDYLNVGFKPGGCRHNVIDRTRDYLIGNMKAPNAARAQRQSGPKDQLDQGTIDFATILLDLDGSFTGSTSSIDGRSLPSLTSSVSHNPFYNAPSQSPECLAFGTQTSPYTFITTTVAQLVDAPSAADNAIDRDRWPATPAVAIYRQWLLKDDYEREKVDKCGDVCRGDQYACPRASFMGMASVHQSAYLTMTQPPGLSSSQTGALYYLDTNSGAQSHACVKPVSPLQTAGFSGEESYVVYNIFPQRDSKTSYQLYVGDVQDLAEIEFRWVRVGVHERDRSSRQRVTDPCDPRDGSGWCKGIVPPKPENGVLTVTIDHAKLLPDDKTWTPEGRADYDRCMPRDLCAYDADVKKCVRCNPAKDAKKNRCLRGDDFLPADIASMNQLAKTDRKPLDDVCEQWSGMVSGQVSIDGGGPVTSADCPAGGCIGFAFKLKKGFEPKPYQVVTTQLAPKSTRCFVQSAWMKDALKETGKDPSCGAPRPQSESDFCADESIDLPVAKDAFIDRAEPNASSGDDAELVVAGDDPARSLLAFDAGAIESFLAEHPLTRATLEVTTREPAGDADALLDAHPLLQDFAEGDPDDRASSALASEVGVASAVRPVSGLVPPRGRLPRLPISGEPGTTWACASDLDTTNDRVDCAVRWEVPGGDYGPATAPPALVAGPAGTVVRFDVTQDVLDGVSRWLLRLRDEELPATLVFHSDEGAVRIGDPKLGPVLILE